MDYAKDRRGTIIGTHQASPHRYYACPMCAADVFLRRGRRRVPHFAHRSGYGKPECEWFFPSDELLYTWSRQGQSWDADPFARPIEPLSLSIELEPEIAARGRRLRGWGLRLTVPKSDDPHGQVSIDCGGGVVRKIPLSKLSLAAHTYPVDLDTQEFGCVWASPEVRPTYKSAIEERITGLDGELVNAFAATAQKYKPRVERLSWGGSYYFVWGAQHLDALHRHLSAHPLAPQGAWSCALATLPDDEDSELKDWLAQATGLEVSPQRRVFGIIYPPTAGIDIYGRVLLPIVDPLIIGLHVVDGDIDHSIQLDAVVRDGSAKLCVTGPGRHLVHVSVDTEATALSFHIDGASQPVMMPAAKPDAGALLAVRFAFRDRERPGLTHAAFHHTESLELLHRVRLGAREIVECTYPAGIMGVLRWRSARDVDWQCFELTTGDSDNAIAKAAPHAVAKINEILRTRTLAVQFSFGVFGQFFSPAEAAPTRRAVSITIPKPLRARILWLCKQSRIYTDRRRRPLDRLTDHDLANLFLTLPVFPAFVAQKRAAEAALRAIPLPTRPT